MVLILIDLVSFLKHRKLKRRRLSSNETDPLNLYMCKSTVNSKHC